MKNSQKQYLETRLRDIRTSLVNKLRSYYKATEGLTELQKLKLIASGEVSVNLTEVKSIVREKEERNYYHINWQDLFDFSSQQAEANRDAEAYQVAVSLLDAEFVKTKDVIMLGSENEAVKALRDLSEMDVGQFARLSPPAKKVEKKVPAKKKR